MRNVSTCQLIDSLLDCVKKKYEKRKELPVNRILGRKDVWSSVYLWGKWSTVLYASLKEYASKLVHENKEHL